MIAPWPQFCAALLANPQLREADPELFARVEASQHAAGGNAAVLPPPTPTVSAGAPGGPPSGPPSQQPGPQGQQLDGGAGVAPDSNSHGSSRFLNLQPADTQGPAASGNGADMEVPPPNAAGGRGGKDVGPSGRDAQSMAPGGKIGGRDAGAVGGPAASGPATASSATGAAAAAGGAQPSNTSLSMGEFSAYEGRDTL